VKLKRQPRTILEVCVAKRGTIGGARAASNVAAWVIQTAELGRVPTVVEYSTYWGVAERTAWRHAHSIESVFGENWRQLVGQLGARVRTKVSGRPSVGELRQLRLPIGALA
jgi:hypothetical protein